MIFTFQLYFKIQLPNNQQTTPQLAQILINEILYNRNVHDRRYFAQEELCNIGYKRAQLQNTIKYIQEVCNTIQKLITENRLVSFTVVLMRLFDKQEVEQYKFTIVDQQVDIYQIYNELYQEMGQYELQEQKCGFEVKFEVRK